MPAVPLIQITKLAVFVHPTELKNGRVQLIACHDAMGDKEFDKAVKVWTDLNAICLYFGPPQPPRPESEAMELEEPPRARNRGEADAAKGIWFNSDEYRGKK